MPHASHPTCLKVCLCGSLHIELNGVRLEPNGLEVDVVALDEAWSHRTVHPEPLAAVVERCTRPLLASWQGWYDRPWIAQARTQHRRRVQEARRWLVSHAVAAADYEDAIHHLEALREHGDRAAKHHCAVMERLMEAEQYVLATQFYEDYRDYLDARDRLLPPHQMTEHYARIPHRPLSLPIRPRSTPAIPEPILGAMSLETPYYIERASDATFYAALGRRDSIICIEGPCQTGATSLLARGLETARMEGGAVALLDFQTLVSLLAQRSRPGGAHALASVHAHHGLRRREPSADH